MCSCCVVCVYMCMYMDVCGVFSVCGVHMDVYVCVLGCTSDVCTYVYGIRVYVCGV